MTKTGKRIEEADYKYDGGEISLLMTMVVLRI